MINVCASEDGTSLVVTNFVISIITKSAGEGIIQTTATTEEAKQ
jgi:hypothetical protein